MRIYLSPSEKLLDKSTEPCTPKVGPRLKFKHRPPNEGEATSTMSNSKRSSISQVMSYKDDQSTTSL